jgi:ketosteroid isomerase-like protein
MAADDRAALERIYEGWGRGDFAVAPELFDPHLVAVFPDPEPVPHYGLDAVRSYMGKFLTSWEDLRFVMGPVEERDGTFLVAVGRSGVGATSGVAIEDEIFHLWTFRGGRVIRLDLFHREPEARRAAGLDG